MPVLGSRIQREAGLIEQEVQPVRQQHREVRRLGDATRAALAEVRLDHDPHSVEVGGRLVAEPVEQCSGQLPTGLGRTQFVAVHDYQRTVGGDVDVLWL